MSKAGILVNKVDTSQLGYTLCMSVNELMQEDPSLDIMVFYETWGKPPGPTNFCMLMERECWGLDGPIIATNLHTAQRAIRCPGPTKKYFYVWNLEWTMLQNVMFEHLQEIYCHPNLELIARSESHAKIITDLWKKPKFVMDNFDKDVLRRIIMV